MMIIIVNKRNKSTAIYVFIEICRETTPPPPATIIIEIRILYIYYN